MLAQVTTAALEHTALLSADDRRLLRAFAYDVPCLPRANRHAAAAVSLGAAATAAAAAGWRVGGGVLSAALAGDYLWKQYWRFRAAKIITRTTNALSQALGSVNSTLRFVQVACKFTRFV
jgi:hypothetical protein